jgi:hemolysin D
LATTQARLQRLQATLPLITQRAEAFAQLAAQHYASRQQALELEQQRLDQQHELAVEQARRQELKAALAEAQRQQDAAQQEFRRQAAAKLAELDNTLAALEQERIKASKRDERQRLLAPLDGVVQQLAVHTVGGVVQPAQELLRIVPHDSVLEIEAWLLNKDVGFVQETLPAEVKVDAFPFTQYGTLPAVVKTLSQDAVQDDQLGLVYAMNVVLERATLEVEGKTIRLTPGMMVSVEVKTGQRRLIEYFLAPLLRYRQESVRER